MRLSKTEAYVLELTTEDCTPLADVFAGYRHHMPGKTEDEYMRLSKDLVNTFLKLGYVKVYLDNLAESTETFRNVTELTHEQIDEALSNRVNWIPELRPKPDLLTIGIVATDKGEQAMHDHWQE